MRALYGLALVLTACTAKDPEDTGPADTSDTDVPADTDTDITDTDDTAPSCEEFELNGILTATEYRVVPNGEITMAIFPFTTEDFNFSVPWESATVGGLAPDTSVNFSWCLGTPPDEAYQSDEQGDPDTDADTDGDTDIDGPTPEVAFYFIGGFVDGDGDGAYDEGEALVHGKYAFLAHIRGAVPPDLEGYDVHLGWNHINFNILESAVEGQQLSDGDTLDLDANLLLNDPGELTGVVVEASEGQTRVGVYLTQGGNEAENRTLSSVPIDASEPGASFSVDFPTPPSDHLGSDSGVNYALYSVIAWDDANPDEAWGEGDAGPFASSSSSAPAVFAIYLEPLNFSSIYYATMFDGAGWHLFSDGYAPEPWEEGVTLVSPP